MTEEKPKEKTVINEVQPASIKLTQEQNKKLEFFITAPMRSADHLMKQLYSDDSFYETTTYAWVDEKDAKKLFIYGVCKEVIKTCVGLINDKEFLQEIPIKMGLEPMHKIIVGSIMDTQTFHIRKMAEMLSFLILFDRNTKKDEEYRIFLNAENMDLALGAQQDFRDLYEERIISNTQYSIDDFSNRIKGDMKKLGVTELWFLNIDKLKKQKPTVFKSKKRMYLDALMVASSDERLALGISYGRGYSRTSRSVHPLLGSHDYGREENNIKKVIANLSYLSMICMHIMHIAYKIMGIEDPAGIAKIMGANFEKSEASKVLAPFGKEFQIGDIVLTIWTNLAEIVDKHTSRYGYKAYKVRYISKPPIPELPEDWLEATSIMIRLMTKDMVRSVYERAAQSITQDKKVSDMMGEVLKLPDEKLLEYAEKTFLDLHNSGILIPTLIKSGFLKKRDEPEF